MSCKKMRLALSPDKTSLGVHKGVLLGYVVSGKSFDGMRSYHSDC